MREAELFDEKLFADPPPRDESPLCMVTMPLIGEECKYMTCCGKNICGGCQYRLSRDICPFCNTAMSNEECNKRLLERIKKYNDSKAMELLGSFYVTGSEGFPEDSKKALELYRRSSRLGSAAAHYYLGISYVQGDGVEYDFNC